MKLTGEQISDIVEALLAAYPSEGELGMMVGIELDENLEAIATGKNLRVLIFNLVTWAMRTDRIDELLKGAQRQNPGNSELAKLMRTWNPARPPAADNASSDSTVKAPTGPTSIDIFLAYSHEDLSAMRKVSEILRTAGLAVWTDKNLKSSTSSWTSAIEEAIGQAQAMVILMSPESKKSEWVEREVTQAQSLKKSIFPIIISGTEQDAVLFRLNNALRLDGRQNLLRVIEHDLLPQLQIYLRPTEPDAVPAPTVSEEAGAEPPTSPSPVLSVEQVPSRKKNYSRIALLLVVVLVVGTVGLYVAERMTSSSTVNAPPLTVEPSIVLTTVTAVVSETATVRVARATSAPAIAEANLANVATAEAILAGVAADKAVATSTQMPGATMTNPTDGAVYAYVPAGPFIMGSSDNDLAAFDDEKPQQRGLDLAAFWIMRTEVTNAQYFRCVEAGVCSAPLLSNVRWDDPDYAQHPINYVTWFQANEYAHWIGGRLPTEAEWEKACRGTDGRIYPWGDEPPTDEYANFDANVGDTSQVAIFSPQGDSPYGVSDMVGNVREWTASRYSAYPYYQDDGREDLEGSGSRVLRGGSFNSNADWVRCAYRIDRPPEFSYAFGGFRVVLSGY